MNPDKKTARVAGLLYLLNGILSGFAFAYVLGKVYVSGDAETTAANVLAHPLLLRIGVVADLSQALIWFLLAMVLHKLLRHVHPGAAAAMVILVAMGSGIVCLNDVFQIIAVRIATDASYGAGFGAPRLNAVILLMLDIHHYGFLIAQIFFGLWLLPFGYLAYESRMFPRWLSVMLVVGGVCYLIGMIAVFLLPEFGEKINVYVTIPSAIAEISMAAYLTVVGVKTDRSNAAPTR